MTEKEKEPMIQTGRVRQHLYALIENADYEMSHSKDNGRPEKYLSLEILASNIVTQAKNTKALTVYEKKKTEINRKYGNGKDPRERESNYRGSFEITHREAMELYETLITLAHDSGAWRIDERPGGSTMTIELFNVDLDDFVIPQLMERLGDDKNFVLIILGDQGTGKSTLAVNIALRLAGRKYVHKGQEITIPDYSIDNVIFTGEQFYEKLDSIDDMPRATTLIIDDASQLANSKTHQSPLNIIVAQLVASARDKQTNLIVTTPKPKNIDKQAREMIFLIAEAIDEDSQGIFYYGKPEWDENTGNLINREFFTAPTDDFKVDGNNAILKYKTITSPILPDELDEEYRYHKTEAFSKLRKEQAADARADRDNREAKRIEARNRKTKAMAEEQEIESKRLSIEAIKKAEIQKGKEIIAAKQRGLKTQELMQKFNLTSTRQIYDLIRKAEADTLTGNND